MDATDWERLRRMIAIAGVGIAGSGLTFMGPVGLMLWWIGIGSSLALVMARRDQWQQFAWLAISLGGGFGLAFVGGELTTGWINATSLPHTRMDYVMRCAAYTLATFVGRRKLNRLRRIRDAR